MQIKEYIEQHACKVNRVNHELSKEVDITIIAYRLLIVSPA
jgi:hypothetical protein